MVCCGPPSTRTPYPVGTCENWALLWQVMHSAALQMGSISPPLPGGQDSKVLPIFRCARTLDVLLRRPLDIHAPVTRCYGEYCRAICSTLAIIAAISRRRVRERDHPEAAQAMLAALEATKSETSLLSNESTTGSQAPKPAPLPMLEHCCMLRAAYACSE